MASTSIDNAMSETLGLNQTYGGAQRKFPYMPVGEATDMGFDKNGIPHIDPRIFDSGEFRRNPYPYYKIMRDHYPVFHDELHNCYFVTRYEDIT